MRIIDIYEARKKVIEQVNIPDLKMYNIGKILYEEIWHMEQLTFLQKWARVIAYVLFKSLHFSFFDDHINNNKLAIEIRGIKEDERLDNQLIYSNIYDYLKPCGHLLIYKELKIDIRGVFYRVKTFINYAKLIPEKCICNRAFFAAQLVMTKDFVNLMEKEKFFDGREFLFLFQENGVIENTIIQTAQRQGVKVISPQHSMPMNRHEDIDQLHFDCFLCDYKLLWNKATKLQYLSAGINEKHLFIVGNTKKMHMLSSDNKKKVLSNSMGVVLDGPKIDGAVKNNKELIDIAAKLADVYRMNCVIKKHPSDKTKNYLLDVRTDSANLSILGEDITMEQYEEMVDFSLGHTTGAMLDLIYDGCFVFQYKTEVEYPIETDDIYIFHDYKELKKNYAEWKKNYELYKTEYEKIVEKYHVKNPVELHSDFFNTLFQ